MRRLRGVLDVSHFNHYLWINSNYQVLLPNSVRLEENSFMYCTVIRVQYSKLRLVSWFAYPSHFRFPYTNTATNSNDRPVPYSYNRSRAAACAMRSDQPTFDSTDTTIPHVIGNESYYPIARSRLSLRSTPHTLPLFSRLFLVLIHAHTRTHTQRTTSHVGTCITQRTR